MRTQPDTPLAPLTTLGLGGPATTVITAVDADEIVTAVRAADAAGEPTLVLAGGSNVVVADEGFPGTVVLVRSTGISAERRDGRMAVTVQAGHTWDDVVAYAVEEGWSGLECLSGVPGSAGATPIQNVGAYGQEVAETIHSVTAYDRRADEIVTLTPDECRFSYRDSAFKRGDRYVVLAVGFDLALTGTSQPIRYGELARELGVPVDGAAPLAEVRAAVLGLRRNKGMVLDPDDPDTHSVGSFFTNPVLTPVEFDHLLSRVRERLGNDAAPPRWTVPGAAGRPAAVKASAAWLIERAGFTKGYGRDGVAISTKHTLALTHRGSGSTKALIDLAREIRAGVEAAFGVTLTPEPVLLGTVF